MKDYVAEYHKKESARLGEEMVRCYRQAAEHIKNENWQDAQCERAAGSIYKGMMEDFHGWSLEAANEEQKKLCALMEKLDAMIEEAARKQNNAINTSEATEDQNAKDRYIVKWQVQDLNKKWTYRYLGGFAVGGYGKFDYEAMLYVDGAYEYPEAVAEWLCKLLEADGLNPEMEKI